MSNVYKLKFASLDEALKRVFGLKADDNLELEVRGKEAVIKVENICRKEQAVKTANQSLLDYMNDLPDSSSEHESTDNASQIDNMLYRRNQHF